MQGTVKEIRARVMVTKEKSLFYYVIKRKEDLGT